MKRIILILFFISLFCPIFVFAEQIDINSATLPQLDEIVHVGLTIAQRIIDARSYNSVQDLSRVKGIGDGKYLQDIIDQGLACVNCQTTQATIQPTQPVDQTPTPTQIPIVATNTATNDQLKPAEAGLPQTPIINYPSGIFINEILPNPEGADETEEWFELFNSNNFDVNLSGWQIKDITGTVTTFTISQNIPSGAQAKISASGFLVFKRPETKISMNNDGDGLNILMPDGKIIDSVNFIKAPLGQAFNKINSGWAWSLTLTPGAKNIISVANSLSKTKNSVNNNDIGVGLADISQTIDTNQDNNKITNPWFLFFTALAITIISASTVLFIKLKIFKKHVRT